MTLPTPTKTGYDFDNWYSDETTVYDGTDNLSTTDGSSVTIKAKWNEHEYTITLHENNGTYASDYDVPSSRLYTASSTLPTSANITRVGYTFDGWYENEELTGTRVTSILARTASNKEYWLKWNENTYTITYNENGGSYASGYTTRPTSRTYTDTASLPNETQISKTGYDFAGWYES